MNKNGWRFGMRNKIRNLIILLFVLVIIFIIVYFTNSKTTQERKQKSEISEIKEEKRVQEENDDTSQEKKDEDEERILENDNSTVDSFYHDLDSTNIQEYVENKYVPVTSFHVKISNKTVYVGKTLNLTVTINPSNATEQQISYSSSNPNVAVVSKKGLITGINPGECEISVTVKNAGVGTIKIQVLSDSNVIYNNRDDKEYEEEGNIEVSNVTENISTNSTTSTSSVSEETTIETQNSSTIIPIESKEDNVTISKDSSINQKTPTIPSQNATSNKEKMSDGWHTINGKKYYYKNNNRIKDSYVDYIYLDNNGVAQKKIGSFSATIYGANAWANQSLSIRKSASSSSSKIGTVPTGGKMTLLSSENSSTKYIKVKYNGTTGYVYSDYIYINLPDVIPDIIYEISNANKSIYKAANTKISNVTGKNLYGYTKKYNSKIGKDTYYAPLLYPVAKQLQTAYNKAKSQGYNLKIYDTYRPYNVSVKINNEFKKLYNSNSKVKKAIDYDKDGNYWGTSWFLANSVSRHNRGVALDLTLTDKNNKELSAQSPMHTLDTRSIRKYNNSIAKKLSSIMTSSGFETLDSEWWHFQEDNYKNSKYTSFQIR